MSDCIIRFNPEGRESIYDSLKVLHPELIFDKTHSYRFQEYLTGLIDSTFWADDERAFEYLPNVIEDMLKMFNFPEIVGRRWYQPEQKRNDAFELCCNNMFNKQLISLRVEKYEDGIKIRLFREDNLHDLTGGLTTPDEVRDALCTFLHRWVRMVSHG